MDTHKVHVVSQHSTEEDDFTDLNYPDLVHRSAVVPPLPVSQLRRRSVTMKIDATKAVDFKFASTADWLKYKLYHHSDSILLILLLILICLQIFISNGTFDLNSLLSNVIMMVSVYYSAIVALKGFNLSITVRRLGTGLTPREVPKEN
jgi:hypothetical protein